MYFDTASLCGLLRLRVDGCSDLQPLSIQRLLVDVEQLEELSGHLPLDQPVGSGGLVFARRA